MARREKSFAPSLGARDPPRVPFPQNRSCEGCPGAAPCRVSYAEYTFVHAERLRGEL